MKWMEVCTFLTTVRKEREKGGWGAGGVWECAPRTYSSCNSLRSVKTIVHTNTIFFPEHIAMRTTGTTEKASEMDYASLLVIGRNNTNLSSQRGVRSGRDIGQERKEGRGRKRERERERDATERELRI